MIDHWIPPGARQAPDLAASAAEAAHWRAEALHKRWLYIETIDRVPIGLLLALIDHAFPPATSGFFEPLAFAQECSAAFDRRHTAEREWADVWKRHDRPVARRTSVTEAADRSG